MLGERASLLYFWPLVYLREVIDIASLILNYSMNNFKKFLLVVGSGMPFLSQAQVVIPRPRVVYYDKKGNEVLAREQAIRWSQIVYQDSVGGVVRNYAAPSGRLTDSTQFAHIRKLIEHGTSVYFRENGAIWYQEEYRQDSLQQRVAYHKNGKLKRREQYGQKGMRTVEECFDQNGKPTAFFEFAQMPTYPGGVDALLRDISMNTRYPTMALLGASQGRVFVDFMVDKTGHIRNVSTKTNAPASLRKAAVHAVEKLPKTLTPGTQDGEPVEVHFTVPVTFAIK
jgi:protein TonB